MCIDGGIANNKSRAIIIWLAVALALAICFPFQAEPKYITNYLVDSVGLSIVIGTLCVKYMSKKLSAFEPLVFCSIVYAALYFFMPIYDIKCNTTEWFGYDFFQYGIEGGLYAIIGYIVFVIAYSHFSRKTEKKIRRYEPNKYTSTICIIWYCISFAANMYYLTSTSGNSITYILSFGLMGESGGNRIETSIGFIGMLSYCLPAITLLYIAYGNSIILKLLFTILMVMAQMANGFRFIIVETAFMLYSFLTRYYNKKVSIINILTVCFIFMVPVLLMTLFRESVRTGAGVDLSSMNSISIGDTFEDAILDNLRIYNNYYALIPVIPSVFPFQYLDMIVIFTLKMIIPSAIWPDKYDGFVKPGIESYYGGAFTGTGQAYPNLGEFYASCGAIGIVVFMALFGLLLGKLTQRCDKSTDVTRLVIYSVTVANCLQTIIRGYTPSNFYLVLFSVAPVFFVRWLSMSKVDSDE